MPGTSYISKIGIGANDFLVKDESLTTLVAQIIEAIGANNDNVADRINNLHSRSFDAEIKISSQNQTEISNIVDGLYKLQYVTITGEGTEATETLNNSAILIQKGTNQYLIKDGKISSRTKTNDTWGTWSSAIPNDSNLVHKTGNETISGTKRFNDNIYFHGEAIGEVYFNDELHDSQIRLKDDGDKGWVQIIKGNGTTATTLQAALDARNNVQADWNQTVATAADYIKNKPKLTNNNGNLDIKPYNWYSGNINIETNFDAGNININSGNHLNLYAGDGNIYLKSYTVYNNKEIAVKDDIPTVATTVTQNDANPVSGSAVYGKFADLIGAAPAALDTLAEIASALNNDADLAGTLTTQISTKIPKVSNPTVDNFASFNSDGTIKDSGVSASSFITSIKTVNNESLVGTGNIVVSGLPQVSASDNGKILMVVNGQWQLVSPSVLYTGQGVPNNAQGNNGDIYMQTD